MAWMFSMALRVWSALTVDKSLRVVYSHACPRRTEEQRWNRFT